MSKAILHRNNPLQGVGLKQVLEELVTYYGFDILYAYLNMNCFKANPNIAGCVKFLKKTVWAREKVELFYLYQYKNLPAVSSEQFNVAPRERIVPEDQKPGEPAILTIEHAEHLQHKRSRNAASRNSVSGERTGSSRAYNSRRSEDNRPRRDNSHNGVWSQPGDARADTLSEDNKPVFDPWGKYKKTDSEE